ncbi:hypothetical protein BD769DRAFT_1779829 [Suillus cothurnatus]|nr:hypothetical protein BD769DRAFT_1779829 [Suillus cothurnatus]
MEYSSDDVAAARSLQFATRVHASMATFWIYDYGCSLDEEWSFLLRSQWSKVKGLYIVTRYLPFVLLTSNLYLSFNPNDNPSKCQVFDDIDSGIGIVSVVFSEFFFILRTYALWNKNRILLISMLSIFFVSFQSIHHTQASARCIDQTFVGASVGVSFATIAPATSATSAIPGITGCYQSSTSFPLLIPILLLSVFELGLMILTLTRAIQSWRIYPSRLYVVLVNHNIFYYVCGLLFSATNIFTLLFLQYSYHTLLYDFQFMILAILATRMHLHLWQVNRHAHRSGALARILISDLSSVNSTL